jgi:hypothetical protein
MSLVAMRATPVSATELAAALGSELRSRGRPVNPGELALLTAHIDFETANRTDLWNWNIGNITTTGTTGDYWQPTKGAAAALKFRAYSSLAAGVKDYIATLVRARAMLDAAEQANTDAFAAAILSTSYTPGIDVQAVANTLAAGAAKYGQEDSNGRVASRVPPKTVASVWGAVVLGMVAITVGTLQTTRRK